LQEVSGCAVDVFSLPTAGVVHQDAALQDAYKDILSISRAISGHFAKLWKLSTNARVEADRGIQGVEAG
jgi:hypothetical protein